MINYKLVLKTFYFVLFSLAFMDLALAIPAGSSDSSWQFTNTSPSKLTSLATQLDGKIVAAGYKPNLDGTYSFSIVRMIDNGSLDMSFGSKGFTFTQVGSGSSMARDVAIQSDGKYVVVGLAVESDGVGENVIAIVRYLSNGLLDTSFGSNGIVTKKINNSYPGNGANNVVLQDDGKIIVIGNSYRQTDNGQISYIDVCKFNSDGSIDTSFGVGGEFSFAVNLKSSIPGGKGLSISSNGDIFITGSFHSGGSENRAFVAKITSSGILDATFGSNGVVIPASSYNGWLSGLFLQL